VLVNSGVFAESCRADGVLEFSLTRTGALLQMGVPQPSMACGAHHFVEKPMWAAWSRLPDYVLGKIDTPPFQAANSLGMFDFHAKVPQSSVPFQEFMDSLSSSELPAVVEKVGWESMGGQTVVDVGGGSGFVMGVVADQFPQLQCICMDLPHVATAAGAPPEGVSIVHGDMFDAATIPKADAVFMKHVLHNWNDEAAVRILSACSAALPADGKVIIAEAVLPDPGQASGASRTPFLFDALKMLSGGRERTLREWEALAVAAGFKLERVERTDCPTSQILFMARG